jgi:hypothetical protein
MAILMITLKEKDRRRCFSFLNKAVTKKRLARVLCILSNKNIFIKKTIQAKA